MQSSIVLGITNNAMAYSAREIANIIWALGKMHFTFQDDSAFHSLNTTLLDRVAYTSQLESDGLAVVSQNERFSAFDIESIFCGLGIMKVLS